VTCTGSLNYLYTKMTNYLNYLHVQNKTKCTITTGYSIGGRSLGTVGTWTKVMKSTRMFTVKM